MNYSLFAAVLCLGILPPTVLGGPIQLINGLPNSYTPGQPVKFDVHLPGVDNLGSYNIDIALESNVGTAGIDYFFDAAASLPAAAHYVFPSTSNYFDAVTVDSATRDRFTLTDFDFSGVNVIPGTNDRVATVAFRTLATFHGALSVFVDAPLLILDTSDMVSTPVSGFSAIQDGIVSAGAVAVTPVPEPTNVLLLMVGAAAGFLGRLRVNLRMIR